MNIHRRALGACCAAILCAILVAGLWPFNPFPKNDVSWIPNENGLRFGDSGVIFSPTTVRPSPLGGAACSVEIWFEPAEQMDSNSILDFYTPSNPLQFKIGQYHDNLDVSRDVPDAKGRLRNSLIEIAHVFERKTLLIAITSSGQETSVYLNGVQVRSSPHFGLSAKDLSGQIVIGTSPTSDYTWAGDLRGLAIFSRELSAAQVAQHYTAWTNSGRVEIGENEGAIAVYGFEERAGSATHSRIASAPDLDIPAHFLVPHQPFLEAPWNEFRPNWSYWEDIFLRKYVPYATT